MFRICAKKTVTLSQLGTYLQDVTMELPKYLFVLECSQRLFRMNRLFKFKLNVLVPLSHYSFATIVPRSWLLYFFLESPSRRRIDLHCREFIKNAHYLNCLLGKRFETVCCRVFIVDCSFAVIENKSQSKVINVQHEKIM